MSYFAVPLFPFSFFLFTFYSFLPLILTSLYISLIKTPKARKLLFPRTNQMRKIRRQSKESQTTSRWPQAKDIFFKGDHRGMEVFLYAHIISGINLASYQLTSIQLCSPEGIPWIKFEKLNIKIRIITVHNPTCWKEWGVISYMVFTDNFSWLI